MNRNRQLYRAPTMAETGKQKLPNLKICIDNNEGSDNEEIIFTDKDDYSFIDEPYSHRVEFSVRLHENNEAKKFERKKYENKDGNFVTGIDITKKEEEEKREERARRFGLEGNNYHVSLAALYTSLGIREEDLHKDERGIRLETVHVRGVQNMSTKDVFYYFQEFAPSTVEWIEDNSCNVVWSDAMTAARALNKLSQSRDDVSSLTNTNENSTAKKSPTGDEENQLTPDTQFDQKETDEASPKESNVAKMNVDEDSNMSAISSVSHSESTCENDSDRQTETKRRPSDSKDSEDAETRETTPQPADMKSEGELSSSEDNVELEKNYRRKLSSRLHETVPAAPDPWNSADDIPWPPGKWRLGVPTSKAGQHIFMRYATKADRKLPGAEKRSQYYVRHGNPNYGGMKGLISKSRKRRIRSVKDEISTESTKDDLNTPTTSDQVELSDWSSRHLHDELASSVQAAATATTTATPPPPAKHRMMRMYADDVEAELKAKRSGHSRVSHRIGGGSVSHRIGSGGHGMQHWVGSLSGSSSKPVKDARQLLSRSDNVGMSKYQRGHIAVRSDDDDDDEEEQEDGEGSDDSINADSRPFFNAGSDLRAKLEWKRMQMPSSVSSTSGHYPQLKIEVLE